MKLTEFVRKLFRRKNTTSLTGGQEGAVPLRIEGVGTAPLTPEPDDAEIAAQAVLEMSLPPAPSRRGGVKSFFRSKANNIHRKDKADGKGGYSPPSQGGAGVGAAYYHRLADRIREGHEQEARQCMRYVAYVEQELRVRRTADLAELERGLYRHLDTVEREGGALKKRWQHCIAEVIVRQMRQPPDGEQGAETKKGQGVS